ncbi:MAG: AI-2E family transporter [Herpetosiphon sp.]
MSALAPSGTPTTRPWSGRRIILLTLTIVAVTAAFYLLYRFSNVIFIVFVGSVLGTALRPAVALLKRIHVPVWAGMIVLYLLLLALFVGVLFLLVPLLVAQGGSLVRSLPDYYRSFHETLLHSSNLVLRNLGAQLPASVSLSAAAPADATPAANTEILSQLQSLLRNVAWFIFGTISVFLIAFFWVVDHDQIVKAILLLFPVDRRPSASQLWEDIENRVGGYVRGTAIIAIIVGIVSYITYSLIGVPSSLVIAVLAGLLEAVPVIGPIITGTIAVVVTLSQAPDKVLYVLVAAVIIQQAEGVLLVPRIMDKAVGVNEIVTLLAIAGFGSLLGTLGAIMAIPLAAVIQVLIDHWLLNAEASTPIIVGRDRIAILRYGAQDLAQDLRERLRHENAPGEGEMFEERVETLVGDLDQFLIEYAAQSAPAAAPALSPAGAA